MSVEDSAPAHSNGADKDGAVSREELASLVEAAVSRALATRAWMELVSC